MKSVNEILLEQNISPQELLSDLKGTAERLIKVGIDLDKWIRCEDELPEKDKSVLLYGKYMGICEGYRITDYPPFAYTDPFLWEREYMIFGYESEIKTGVTHWQPLPEKPKQ